LQHILHTLNPAPALIKTATWDVVAWNDAASAVLTDYGLVPPREHNLLRGAFLIPGGQTAW
jgi:hypothetical protein